MTPLSRPHTRFAGWLSNWQAWCDSHRRSALGELLFDVGRWDEALREVAAVNDDIKDPAVACCDHGIAAVIYFHRNFPRQALRNLALTISGAERIGDRVI